MLEPTMESESTITHLPPQYDTLDPATLILAGQSIVAEGAPSTPLYQLNRDVTAMSQKGSSAVFERVEYDGPEESEGVSSPKQRFKHLFYLVHPANSQYRKDVPAYYITSVSSEMPGNIHLEVSRGLLQKTGFNAMLSANKTSADDVLFDEQTQQTLFNVKPKWAGGQYQWTDSDGQKIAHEGGKGAEHKLVVLAPLKRQTRDALVALWALRLWHDMAESKAAKREELENLTASSTPSAYPDMKLVKRTRALGAAAGVGGG